MEKWTEKEKQNYYFLICFYAFLKVKKENIDKQEEGNSNIEEDKVIAKICKITIIMPSDNKKKWLDKFVEITDSIFKITTIGKIIYDIIYLTIENYPNLLSFQSKNEFIEEIDKESIKEFADSEIEEAYKYAKSKLTIKKFNL